MDSYTNKEEIFEELLKKYGDEIFREAKKFVGDDHTAKDLAQEAFWNLYTHYESVDPEKIVGYLKTSVLHSVCNRSRDCKYLNDENLDDVNECEGKVPSAEELYLRKMKTKFAKTLSDNIMERLRYKNKEWYEIIYWSYYLKLPTQELARRKGIDAKTLYARLKRAKCWVQKTFEKEYKEYEDS